MVLLRKDPIHSIQILRRYKAESQYQEREYGLCESVLIRKACSSWQREGRESSFMGLGIVLIGACTKTVDAHGAIMEFNNAICLLSLSLSYLGAFLTPFSSFSFSC